jgi:hypothetical protein
VAWYLVKRRVNLTLTLWLQFIFPAVTFKSLASSKVSSCFDSRRSQIRLPVGEGGYCD